jgi:hypothetical protein
MYGIVMRIKDLERVNMHHLGSYDQCQYQIEHEHMYQWTLLWDCQSRMDLMQYW